MSLTPQPARKRDRVAKFLRRSPSPLPIRTAAASAPAPSQSPAYTTNGSSILADALEALKHEDRQTIRALLLPANAISIDAAIGEAYDCARALQQREANNRWSWTCNDRRVNFSDQWNKIVQFLDKFKSVGDVVANVDPVHVGIPWAGVRTLLEVCIRQDDTLSPMC
jgi:hypothetical protein